MRKLNSVCRNLVRFFMPLGSLLVLAGCSGDNGTSPPSSAVTVQQMGRYYQVVMDYSGRTHGEMGNALAQEIQRVVPEYEATMDSLLAAQFVLMKELEEPIKEQCPECQYRAIDLNEAVDRAQAILKNVPQEYVDELHGMQEVFNYSTDELGDGRLSANEMAVLQLFPDVLRPWGCSASAAFGAASATGKTVLGRNLDWFSGPLKISSTLHAVASMKKGTKTTCNISMLGMVSAGSMFNQDKVFGAVLDAEVPILAYPSDVSKKRSYVYDLRYALENFSTLQEVADFMKSQDYAFNHLIFLADESAASVVENNIGSTGRGLRTSTSVLRTGLSWGIPDAVATVNDFRLPDNYFAGDDVSNNARWESFIEQYKTLLANGKIGLDEMKEIAGYNGPQKDGDDEHGALFLSSDLAYKYTTNQSVILHMDTLEMWVHFAPSDGEFPKEPDYIQVNHPLHPADTLPTWTNRWGMTFALIPAGTFIIGSPANEPGRDSEEGPQPHVTIREPFCMQVT